MDADRAARDFARKNADNWFEEDIENLATLLRTYAASRLRDAVVEVELGGVPFGRDGVVGQWLTERAAKEGRGDDDTTRS